MGLSVKTLLPETQENATGSVRAVERALQLIEVFARSRGPFSITELSGILELAPSTVHRLVQTLTSLGYVVQYQESKRYGVGRGIALINRAMLLKYEFARFAQPHLEALVKATGETANLAALYGTSMIYLNQVESPAMVRVSNPIGTLVPLHCTAVGKVFLADFNKSMLEDVFTHAGLEGFTPKTLTSPKALQKELSRVRNQGYALDDEEFAQGVRCIAVGVRGSSGAVVTAFSLSGPSSRVTDERISQLAAAVAQAAERFERQMREP